MNCEEFALYGIGAEHDTDMTAAQLAAAREHSLLCPGCAALARSWEGAREKLALLADVTRVEGAPARVEMRLRQEFRTRHQTLKTHRTAVVATWILGAAAVLVGAISWSNWHERQGVSGAGGTTNVTASGIPGNSSAGADSADSTLVADNDENEFTALPGAIYTGNDDASIVRVRMQRSSLGTFGFPVNEDRAADWIQVDLLVGNDGSPQAVRLPSDDARE